MGVLVQYGNKIGRFNMKKMVYFFTNKWKSGKSKKATWLAVSLVLIACVAVGVVLGLLQNKGVNLNAIAKNLNTYDISLNYVSEHTFSATQSVTITNTSDDAWQTLSFHLYATAFSEGAVNKPVSSLNANAAYPNGASYGGITVSEISGKNGAFTFDYEGIDKQVLKVVLNSPLNPDQKTVVNMNYSFTLPNIHHRYGYGANATNVANFYPILAVYENGAFVCDPYHSNGDPFYSEMSNYNVKLTIPSTFKVAHTGYQVNASTTDLNTTYQLKALAVRDFAFVMSEKFEKLSSKVGKTDVYYYYYADSDPNKSLQAACDSIATYNELFGVYPYSTYSVVQTNFVHGGMEYPNLVYISDAVVKQSDYLNVIIHETAHQWWYQLVGSNAYQTPWLDEGLTEFSCVLFYEQNPSYGIQTEELLTNATNSYISFVELCQSVLGSVDTSMNRTLNNYSTEPEYVYMTYVKGMLLFDQLRELVGKANFNRALKTYVQENQFSNVTPDVLIETFEAVSLRKLNSFFGSWTEGKVVLMPLS